jgi:hypothetical protein
MSVKSHNIKVWLRYSEGFDKPIVTPQFPMVYDLGSDPGERNNLFSDKMDIGWMMEIVFPYIAAYERSVGQYPNIKPGQEFTGLYKNEIDRRLPLAPAEWRTRKKPSRRKRLLGTLKGKMGGPCRSSSDEHRKE